MPNRIILLNNKPIIARFIQGKNVYGHMGSFWIKRTAESVLFYSFSKNIDITLNKELPGVSATVSAIKIDETIYNIYKSAYGNVDSDSNKVKSRFTKNLSVYLHYNDNSRILDAYNKTVWIKLDSVVRMISLTIHPYVTRKFKTKNGETLQGSKGMWCNGEIIMFESIQLLYSSNYIVTVKQDYLTAYNNILSRGNLTNMKCFLILDEERV